MSKELINFFLKNAALDLSVKDIRANEFYFGMIDTHILDNSLITSEQFDVYANYNK